MTTFPTDEAERLIAAIAEYGRNSISAARLTDTLRGLITANKALSAERDALRLEPEKARGYLIRNIIEPLHPNVTPLPDLIGVCTQIDNITAGHCMERDALAAECARLREALRPFAGLADEIEMCAAAYNEGEAAHDPQNWSKSCDWEHLLAARAALGARAS